MTEDRRQLQLVDELRRQGITDARVLARGFTLLDAKDYEQVRDF